MSFEQRQLILHAKHTFIAGDDDQEARDDHSEEVLVCDSENEEGILYLLDNLYIRSCHSEVLKFTHQAVEVGGVCEELFLMWNSIELEW